MKKVLAFIDWYKPGYKAGGTVTAFSNFVEHLEDEFEFKIVTRNKDYCEDLTYENIVSDCWVIQSKISIYYLSEANVSFKKIKSIINNSSFDWIYINGIFSIFFSLIPVLLASKKNFIVNPHGMLSEQAFSVKRFKKSVFLVFANLFSIYKNAIFHVANVEEAESVKKRIKCYKVIKVVNQLPRKINSNFLNKPSVKNNPTRFICVSRISQEKGILKMIKAFEKVKENLSLDIYGPIYDTQYWKLCEIAIEKLPINIKVNYLGSIKGSEIPNLLKTYDYFILLSEGENFGHAILEGLSAGLPIIISDQTPWKDLESKGIGWDINNESSKIPEIIELACTISNENYSLMSINCFKFAKDFCENPKLLQANKKIFS